MTRDKNRQILQSLTQLTSQEAQTIPGKKLVLKGVGSILGAVSSYVYYIPAKSLAQKYNSPFYGVLLIGSAVGINAIVSIYFNVVAVQEYFDLWDPNTHLLIIPKSHLAGIGFWSFISAFCFATLVLDVKKPATYANMFLQLLTYAAQHVFAIKDVYDKLPELPSKKEANRTFRESQSTIIDLIDNFLLKANKELYDNKTMEVNLIFDANKICNDQLINSILSSSYPSSSSTRNRSILTLLKAFIDYPVQLFGVFVTFVGNIGYYNATINGFLQLPLLSIGTPIAWALASACMLPVYVLAFLLTFRNFAKLSQIVSGGFSIHDFPLAIKKTPWFSSFCAISLASLAGFSYGSALGLLNNAIYNDNLDNPARFGFMDNEHQQMRDLYSNMTIAATILFNIFPVPEVVNFLAEKYVGFLGSSEDKQQIELLSFVKAMRNRAVKADASIFFASDSESKLILSTDSSSSTLDEPLLRSFPRRKNFCAKITETCCWLFRRPFFSISSRNLQQQEDVWVHISSDL